MTNLEKFQSMTVEEFADVFFYLLCDLASIPMGPEGCPDDLKCIVQYLNKEADV